MYKNLTNETTSVTQRAELYQKNNRGAVPILFGMDIVVSYSVMKPLRRIDAL